MVSNILLVLVIFAVFVEGTMQRREAEHIDETAEDDVEPEESQEAETLAHLGKTRQRRSGLTGILARMKRAPRRKPVRRPVKQRPVRPRPVKRRPVNRKPARKERVLQHHLPGSLGYELNKYQIDPRVDTALWTIPQPKETPSPTDIAVLGTGNKECSADRRDQFMGDWKGIEKDFDSRSFAGDSSEKSDHFYVVGIASYVSCEWVLKRFLPTYSRFTKRFSAVLPMMKTLLDYGKGTKECNIFLNSDYEDEKFDAMLDLVKSQVNENKVGDWTDLACQWVVVRSMDFICQYKTLYDQVQKKVQC